MNKLRARFHRNGRLSAHYTGTRQQGRGLATQRGNEAGAWLYFVVIGITVCFFWASADLGSVTVRMPLL